MKLSELEFKVNFANLFKYFKAKERYKLIQKYYDIKNLLKTKKK